jgi:hypothetical protein
MSTIGVVFIGTDERAKQWGGDEWWKRSHVEARGVYSSNLSELWAIIENKGPVDYDGTHALVSLDSKQSPPPLQLVRFPDRFVATLAGITLETWVAVVAARWNEALGNPAVAGDSPTLEFVKGVIELARAAKRTNQNMYLWVVE